MAIPARDPLIAYLLVHATMLRDRQVAPAAAAPWPSTAALSNSWPMWCATCPKTTSVF